MQVCTLSSSPGSRTLLTNVPDNYHISFPNDSKISKGVVYGVYCAELAQTLIVTRDCFTTYAAGFGNFDALNSAQTIWLSAPIMIGLSTFPPVLRVER